MTGEAKCGSPHAANPEIPQFPVRNFWSAVDSWVTVGETEYEVNDPLRMLTILPADQFFNCTDADFVQCGSFAGLSCGSEHDEPVCI